MALPYGGVTDLHSLRYMLADYVAIIGATDASTLHVEERKALAQIMPLNQYMAMVARCIIGLIQTLVDPARTGEGNYPITKKDREQARKAIGLLLEQIYYKVAAIPGCARFIKVRGRLPSGTRGVVSGETQNALRILSYLYSDIGIVGDDGSTGQQLRARFEDLLRYLRECASEQRAFTGGEGEYPLWSADGSFHG